MIFTYFSTIAIVFGGAAILATMALMVRQTPLVAYMILGVLLGPFGLGLIKDPTLVHEIGDFGVVFLLFLAGLHLDPKNLIAMLSSAILVTLTTSFLFAALAYMLAVSFSFGQADALVIALSMMFSSTIIGLKLLPGNVLHQQHLGEVIISVLLIQDLLAITTIIFLHSFGLESTNVMDLGLFVIAIPGITLFAFLGERYVVSKLFKTFVSL